MTLFYRALKKAYAVILGGISRETLVLFSVCTFILYKFFSVYCLWRGRFSPPFFDDAYFYLGTLYNIANKGSVIWENNLSGINYFTYNIYITSLSLLSDVSIEKTFHFFFFLGSAVLPFILYIFFKSLVKERDQFFLIPLLILALGAFNGQVSYHGFYWIVPSFIMTILFLVTLAALDKKENPILIILLIFSLSLAHPIGAYSFVIIFLYLLLTNVFTRKNYTFAIGVAAIFFIIQFFLWISFWGNGISIQGNTSYQQVVAEPMKKIITSATYLKNRIIPYESSEASVNFIQNSPNQQKPDFKTDIKVTSVDKLNNYSKYFYSEYLMPIINGGIFLVLFILGLIASLYLKHYKIIILFIISFVLSYLASSLNPFGYRFLIFTWILTFIISGYALYWFWMLKSSKIIVFPGIVLVGFLVVRALYFNYNMISSFNVQDDFKWDEPCVKKYISTNRKNAYSYNDKYTGSILYYMRSKYEFPISFLSNDNPDKNTVVVRSVSENNRQSIFKQATQCGEITFYERN